MEPKQLKQIEGWFKKLNERFDDTNKRIENRYTALLNVCTYIRADVESLKRDLISSKSKYEARLVTLELALQEVERRLSH